MCGFVGIATSKDPSHAEREEILSRMSSSIMHRGPNSTGNIESSFLFARFLRLSIQDLNGGDQPIHNESGSISVFLNGEIYNHLQFRDELTRKGHILRSNSDAEILPHLYEEHGIDFLSKLNGMFSILIVDRDNNRSFLCRDPMGIKPLYYASKPGYFIFGSELKSVLASELFQPEIDNESVLEYINTFYCSDPKTLVKGLRKVPAGSYVEIDQGLNHTICNFYSFPYFTKDETIEPDLDELEHLLTSAVDMQLAADVPVGISLSGGLDSSLLASLASRSKLASDICAFTVHFEGTPDDEVSCAKELVRNLGLAHKTFTSTSDDFLENSVYMTWISDEPIADPAFFAAQHVAEIASREVTVILSGSGADELFAGYGHHRLSKKNGLIEALLRSNLPLMRKALSPFSDSQTIEALSQYQKNRTPWHLRCASNLSLADHDRLSEILGCENSGLRSLEVATKLVPHADALNQQLFCDTTLYLRSQLLPLQDRTTMAASIEGRVPYLDHRVVEYAFKIDGKYKLPNNTPKGILKDLANRIDLPSSIINRKKIGFPNAVQNWLSGPLGVELKRILLHPSSYTGQNLAPWLEEKLHSSAAIRNNWQSLYALFMLNVWHELFIKRKQWTKPNFSMSDLFDI